MTSIRTLFIFEILGKPPEHIKLSLEKMIEELEKQEKMEVVRKVVHEPKLVEQKEGDTEEGDSSVSIKSQETRLMEGFIHTDEKKKLIEQEIYSTFAEVEIVTEDVKLIMAIVFNMLPSHVEILEPSEFNFSNHEFSGIMSEITIRMHKYDEVTKYLMLERNELLKRLNEKDKMIGVADNSGAEEKVESKEENSKES